MDIVVGQVCPLCGGPGELWTERQGVALRRCHCGVLLAWGWESPAAYEEHYTTLAYHADACRSQGLPTQWERFEEHHRAGTSRIRVLESWEALGPGADRLLDIGASNGALVAAAWLRGYRAAGLEPSAEMCRWAWREHGLALWCGAWEEIAGSWDLVTATDVIEHLLHPLAFLRRCRRHAPQLYLETPEWRDDREAHWKHIKPFEHPCLYSEPALTALAARAGWQLSRVDRPVQGKLALLLQRVGTDLAVPAGAAPAGTEGTA